MLAVQASFLMSKWFDVQLVLFPDGLRIVIVLVRSDNGHTLVGLNIGFKHRVHENVLELKKGMGVGVSNRRDETILKNVLNSMCECDSFH
jgi:hypothetical protein